MLLSKLWEDEISGPVLAIVGIVLLIVQAFVTDVPTATKALKCGAWVTLGAAAVMVLVAQYKAWSLERDKYEAEATKNGQPEIKGEAFNFRDTGQRVTGVTFWNAEIRFEMSVCNHRPVNTNMKRVEIDGQLMVGAARFSKILAFKPVPCKVMHQPPLDTNPILPHAMDVKLIVEAWVEIDADDLQKHEAIKLDGLKIRVVDGLGGAHVIGVRAGEELALVRP